MPPVIILCRNSTFVPRSLTAMWKFLMAGILFGHLVQFVVMCSKKCLGTRLPVFHGKYSTIAQAIDMPSYVLVPRPISSNNTRDLSGYVCSKWQPTPTISTMKVDSLRAISSPAPARVNNLSTMAQNSLFSRYVRNPFEPTTPSIPSDATRQIFRPCWDLSTQ